MLSMTFKLKIIHFSTVHVYPKGSEIDNTIPRIIFSPDKVHP